MVIKMLFVNNILWKLTDKTSFQEICASWKQMLGPDKKILKTLNTRARVILALSFSDDIIFPFVCLLSKVCFRKCVLWRVCFKSVLF